MPFGQKKGDGCNPPFVGTFARTQARAALPDSLRRLLQLHVELDYLPTSLRRNPCDFSLKAVRDIEFDYLCHESLYCLPL